MKVRTCEDLVDRLDADLAWRRSELVSFHRAVASVQVSSRPALLRSSVALLYAHWEGFVKQGAHLYLCFLATQNLKMEDLKPELAGLAMRKKISDGLDSKHPKTHADLVRTIRERSAARASLPTDKSAVRTESNLSFRVFESILTSIGLEAGSYAEHSDLIDSELVAARNRIVHGEYEAIDLDNWLELRDVVLSLMARFKDQVANGALLTGYLAENPAVP